MGLEGSEDRLRSRNGSQHALLGTVVSPIMSRPKSRRCRAHFGDAGKMASDEVLALPTRQFTLAVVADRVAIAERTPDGTNTAKTNRMTGLQRPAVNVA